MRTNIEIDDALMRRAMRASGLKTKKAAVAEALRLLAEVRGQASFRKYRGSEKIENVRERHKSMAAPGSWSS